MVGKIRFIVFMACAVVASASDYSSWRYYRDITASPATAGGITAAESNYPLLLRLTTAGGSGAGAFDFTQAMGSANDLRFTASDGVTDLPYEIERWDSANGAAEIWVKVDALSGGVNTVIRMYWGKPASVAGGGGSGVFNSTVNNFKAVFHFNNSVNSSADIALTPANNGTSDITTTTIIGGHARNLNTGTATTNTTNWLDLGASTADTGLLNSAGASTLGAWVYVTNFATGSGSYGTLIAHGAGDTREHFLRSTRASSTTTFWTAGMYNGTDFRDDYVITNSAELNNWHYIVGTYAGGTTGSIITLYRDGVQVGTPSTLTSNFTNSTQNWVIGRYGATTSGRYFSGYVDEARIANAVRDASWIKWDYETQKANQTCISYGTPQSGIPGAPTGATGVAGNAQVAVSWTAPSNTGSSAITSYTVTTVQDTTKHCATTGGTSCTVTGLTNGTAYTFTVTATNAAGTGPASSPSASVTPVAPVGAPDAPTGVTGTAGNAQVAVSWTAPSSNGGSAITGYTVTSNPDGKTCTTTGALTCTVTTLTNGSSYTFTVTATNSSGTGAASAPSAAVTPVGAPGAPLNVTGVAGNAQVAVSWTAPSNGGSAITGYNVVASPGGAICVSTGALTCTVTGLTNGTAYTFTATATNTLGTSAASAPSAAVTPVSAPSAPRGATGVAGDGQVAVSWVAPSSSGGLTITAYTVTTVQDTSKHCSTTGALTCTVTGLASGTAYTFTVTATNSAGTSVASTPSASVTTGIMGFSTKNGFGIHVTGASVVFHLPAGVSGKRVSILDVRGLTVWSQSVGAGVQELSWNGRTAGGSAAHGIYLVRLTGNGTSTLLAESKVMLLP